MKDLSREEIITQLKRLGINALSELNSYLKEYRVYYKMSNFHSKTNPFLKEDKEEMKLLDDKRKFTRFSIFLDLKFKLPKETVCFLGVTRNFSRKGFCFESNNLNFQSKEILSCDLKLPGEDKYVSISGRTVWAKQANGKYLVGAELLEVDREPYMEDFGWLNRVIRKFSSF